MVPSRHFPDLGRKGHGGRRINSSFKPFSMTFDELNVHYPAIHTTCTPSHDVTLLLS
jgi:hypothetical protein